MGEFKGGYMELEMGFLRLREFFSLRRRTIGQRHVLSAGGGIAAYTAAIEIFRSQPLIRQTAHFRARGNYQSIVASNGHKATIIGTNHKDGRFDLLKREFIRKAVKGGIAVFIEGVGRSDEAERNAVKNLYGFDAKGHVYGLENELNP